MTNPERAPLLWLARNMILMLARSGGSRATERGEALVRAVEAEDGPQRG